MAAETLGLEVGEEEEETEKMPAEEGGRAENDCYMWAGKAAGHLAVVSKGEVIAEKKPAEAEHTVGRLVGAIAATDARVGMGMWGAVVGVRLVVILEMVMTAAQVVSTGGATSEEAAKVEERGSKGGRGGEREARVAAMEGATLSRTGRSSWNEDPAGRSQSPCSVPRTSSRRAQYRTSSPSGRASDSTLPPRQKW